jgi:hypothetical protein
MYNYIYETVDDWNNISGGEVGPVTGSYAASA